MPTDTASCSDRDFKAGGVDWSLLCTTFYCFLPNHWQIDRRVDICGLQVDHSSKQTKWTYFQHAQNLNKEINLFNYVSCDTIPA